MDSEKIFYVFYFKKKLFSFSSPKNGILLQMRIGKIELVIPGGNWWEEINDLI